MYKHSEIRIYNDLDYIQPVCDYIASIAKKFRFNEKEIFQLRFAMEEILANIINYSYDSWMKGEIISIIPEIITNGIKIIIRDKGLPRDIYHLPVFEPNKISENVSEEGLAEYLVHNSVDTLTFRNLGKEGQEIELIKYASEGSIFNKIKPQDEKPYIEIPLSEDKFKEIRLPRPEEAGIISKLFYRAYGYSYVSDAVYFPERYNELIANRKLFSAIATTESGEIVGHIALMKPSEEAEIVEWGMAVTDPRYRGQGIMHHLSQFILNSAIKNNFKGIFSHSVTNHIFTQKTNIKLGIKPIALMVGYAYSDLQFKGIHQKLSQRESTFVEFRFLQNEENIQIYLPDKHREIIKKIYMNLGVTINELPKPKSVDYAEKTILDDSIKSAINIAEIIIHQFGKNAISEIKHYVKRHCINRIDVIYLILNLEDPALIDMLEPIEELGFFFSGVFPYYVFKHTLILQGIPNYKYDYSLIESYTDLAKELKDYIFKLDPNQV